MYTCVRHWTFVAECIGQLTGYAVQLVEMLLLRPRGERVQASGWVVSGVPLRLPACELVPASPWL